MNDVKAPDTSSTALALVRAQAGKRAQAMGLPRVRDEYWRYTPLGAFISEKPAPVALTADEGADCFGALETLRMFFVDGVFDPVRSDWEELGKLSGLKIDSLTHLSSTHWVRERYGSLEAKGQSPVARPLAALNSAEAGDGLAIEVSGAISKPIEIVYQRRKSAEDIRLHHVLRVVSGSVTLLESGVGGARFNSVFEIDIATGAKCHHLRVQPKSKTVIASHIFAELGPEAEFRSFTLSEGAKLTRNEAVITLAGDKGAAHVAGVCFGSEAMHHDDTVFITHDSAHCESRQVFKKALQGGATGVFQGKILVKEGAQKTDGYQISQALLLDEESYFLAKPELEIYADDVACSHGSTTGSIDESALFYLRTRGIGEAEARGMLVLSFLAAAVEEIKDPQLGEIIRNRLEVLLNSDHD